MNEITKALLDGKAIVIEMDHPTKKRKKAEFRGYMKNGSLHGCYRFHLPEPAIILNRFVKPDELDNFFEDMFSIVDNAKLIETFEP